MTTATTMIITSVTLLTGFSSFGLLVLVAGYGTSGFLCLASQLPVGLLAPAPPSNRPKRGLGVGELVGAGLVLKGGRSLFARRLLFTSQCSLPSLPASQTPIFRVCTTLWRKPHGHAEELLGLQWEDADFDRRTIRHTVSGSIVAQHSRHRCVVLRLAYFLPL